MSIALPVLLQHDEFYLILMFLLSPTLSLKFSERSLQELAKKQGSNVMEIVRLVKENEEILDLMKVSNGIYLHTKLHLNLTHHFAQTTSITSVKHSQRKWSNSSLDQATTT